MTPLENAAMEPEEEFEETYDVYEELRREIERYRKRVYRYRFLGALLIGVGVYFLFLALLLVVRPLNVGAIDMPLLYTILIAIGAMSFAIGIYLFGAT